MSKSLINQSQASPLTPHRCILDNNSLWSRNNNKYRAAAEDIIIEVDENDGTEETTAVFFQAGHENSENFRKHRQPGLKRLQ